MRKKHFEIESLPLEMIVRIFKNLSFKDLQQVVQASRRLLKAGSDPSLWSYSTLNKTLLVEKGLNHLIKNYPRYKLIKKLDLWGVATNDSLTNANICTILSESVNTKLEEMNLHALNLSLVPPHLLATAISRLKRANLRFTRLGTNQLEELFQEIAKPENHQFTGIDLGFLHIEEVDASLLANCLAKLVTVFLYKAYMTPAQVKAFLTKVKSSPRLEMLDLHGIDVSQVPARVLADAMSGSKLKKVNFMSTRLTEEQKRLLFLASPLSKSLDTLNVHGLDMSHLPPPILSTAVNNLSHINLVRTSLTTDQCVHMLQNTKASKTLKVLNLSYVNLSQVPPLVIVEGVRNLRKANLMRTDLAPPQCNAFMTHLLDRESTLEDINLNYVNLSSVDPETLGGGISRLYACDLSYTSLTVQQSIRLLEKCVEGTKLKYLSLCGIKTQTGYRGGWKNEEDVKHFSYVFRRARRKIKRLFVKQDCLRATPTLFYEIRLFFNDQDPYTSY